MSWFDKLKDAAKTVALSVTGGVGGAGTSSIAGAVPINHNSFWSSLSNAVSSSDDYSESVNEDEATSSQATASYVHVTTRARFTYGLDSEIMSWFDTVKDVAKSVVKGINAVIGGPNIHNQGSFALPYKDGPRSRANDSSDEDEVPNARVTTRARISYELDRFSKNALLLFVQIQNNSPMTGKRVEETTTQDINVLLETFTAFRFEVNTHIDLTCGEIENVCREFFQQNFEDYGAIVVVVLSFEGTVGALSASDGRFSESIIFRHLTDDLNPTLINKPRVYITEANRTASSEGPSTFSLPFEGHRDVLGLHVPTIDHSAMLQRPLLLFCKNVNDMANSTDFVTILEKSIEELHTEAACAFDNRAIELNHTFTKDMILARA